MTEETLFNQLNQKDVNDHVEKKNGDKGKVEVYAEFVFNEDGKVITCKELTLPYNEELNGIGSVK